MKGIVLDHFNNKMAFDMASKVIALAESRNQHIAIEVCRLHHTVVLYVDDGLSMDKHHWLRRKSNVARQFEESSLSVKQTLSERGMTLEKNFGLDAKDFVAKGGAIPLFVKGAGMVGIITVSGLKDEEDHAIILDALQGKYV